MKQRNTQVFSLILISAAIGVGVWTLLRFTAPKLRRESSGFLVDGERNNSIATDPWSQAVEKVKADRGEPMGGAATVEIPTELRHYSDTHWFLATQVAEVRKFNVQSCQDFVDLAAMIKRDELVSIPAVTDKYILFGVGGNVDDGVFTRFENDHNIGLYNEAQLRDEYARLDAARSNRQGEIADNKKQLSAALKTHDRAKQRELQKQIASRQQDVKSIDENKSLLDQSYGPEASRQRLFADYASLQALAQNFGGRTYNLNDPSDRQAMKLELLRSLRPEAFKVLQEIAADYLAKFDRPLPVSSLVRPEQYQHALNKVNRNAVLIDTPPHSTGLAFDIDYRYMSGAEQSFVMAELARLKDDGRIEVLRERNANYHVFVFIDGRRPSDELITASLPEASAPKKEANHATKKPAKAKSKSGRTNRTKAKPKNKKRR